MGPAVTHALPTAAAPAESLLATTTSRVVCGPAHALALPQAGQGGAALVWGRNCSGQLGLGDLRDRHWPTPLPPPPPGAADQRQPPPRRNAEAAAAAPREGHVDEGAGWGRGVGLGSFHSVVSWGGRLFASGRGRRGQTGLGAVHDVPHFTEIAELRGAGVSMVACGEDFTIAATEEQAWGFGHGTKLGQAHTTHDCLRPVPIRGIPAPIRKVVSGWGHTLVLAGDQVLAWGWNRHGQCGLGHKEFVPTVQPVQALAGLDVVDVAAGATHSLALTRAGAVLVWGSHADGKLGLGDDGGDQQAPHRLESFGGLRVVGLAAGADHTAAITEDGGLWLWGFGQHGALGFAEGANENAPRRLELRGRVEAVSCGMDITVVQLATGRLPSGGGHWSGCQDREASVCF